MTSGGLSSLDTLAGVSLRGCGSAMPSQSLSNAQLSERVETSDDWIRSRTGIRHRRVLSAEEPLQALAASAGSRALDHAGWSPDTVDLLLVATSTPDDLFGMAPSVQARMGTAQAVAFDLTAACSGFLFALVTAAQYLRTGSMRRAVAIGADQLSSWVDWDDRRTCVLFGDGAGAIAMEICEPAEDGLPGFRLRSDGRRGAVLRLPRRMDDRPLVDGARWQPGGFLPIEMNGQEVYKFAVRDVPAILRDMLKASSVDAASVDWLLLHQANQRILDAVAERLGIPAERILSNLADYGNTSAATIPLMLDEAVRDGRIRPGHLIASSGFGAGLSWGAALMRWQGPKQVPSA